MDGSRFDLWTRRTFGFAAGGVAASLVGLILRGETESKKKRNKKKRRKCKKLAQLCNPTGKRKCCKDLVCDTRENGNIVSCCKKLGASCVAGECCNFLPVGSACVDGTCIVI